MWRNDAIKNLASRLKGFKRILLYGDMGTGKSTLALDLTRLQRRQEGCGQVLALDPGTPPFGIPGALSRGWWEGDELKWADSSALCTLDAARFRLPLVRAASRLLADAEAAEHTAPLIIDPPGVVRGVAGSELLEALVTALQVDAVVSVLRENAIFPLAQELAWLPVHHIALPAAPEARRPARSARSEHRTLLWNRYLAQSTQKTYAIDRLPVLGTPPPRHLPDAWAGRQVALLDASGRTLEMGEVVDLAGMRLTLRLPGRTQATPAALLIRDAGRNSRAMLETVAHAHPLPGPQTCYLRTLPRV